jgi:sulfite exporter TauE/SafE
MLNQLVITAFLMGLVGGPHCVVMCGAACAGVGQAQGKKGFFSLSQFHLGRLIAYSLLGFLAATSMQIVAWFSAQLVVIRPVWSLLHVAMMVLGLFMLGKGNQPLFLEHSAKKVWLWIRQKTQNPGNSSWVSFPFMLGLAWSLMPCGLLYSALLVAGIANNPYTGAFVMLSFAFASSVSLIIGPWFLLRLRSWGSGSLGIRLAGLALAGVSAYALYMAMVHNQAPWCITP